MTQGMIDTTSNNSLYSIIRQPESTGTDCENNDTSFMEVIEECSDKISQTIEDFKNAKNLYMDSHINFKNFLQQEIQQANDENSLNLTLAKDIKNLIAQFQQDTTLEKDDTTPETTSRECNISTDTNPTEISSDIQQIASVVTDEVSISTTTAKIIDMSLLSQETTLKDIEVQDTNSVFQANNLVQIRDTANNTSEIISSLANKSAEITKTITNNKTVSAQDPTIDKPEISDEMLQELNVESVEAETTSDYQQNYDTQQQTPEEHAIKAMINNDGDSFDSKSIEFQKSLNSDTKITGEHKTEKIIDQVTKQLNGIKANSKVNIVLNPESLGKVSIQVAKNAEGMSAQFTVSTNEAKEILLKNLDGLKETLLSHGINSDNVSVKMNETQKSEYKQDWTEQENSNNKNKEQQHQHKNNKKQNLFEKMMAYINKNEIENI